jgi:hypothetical protein
MDFLFNNDRTVIIFSSQATVEKINSNYSAILVQLHNSGNSSISVDVAFGGYLDYSGTFN